MITRICQSAVTDDPCKIWQQINSQNVNINLQKRGAIMADLRIEDINREALASPQGYVLSAEEKYRSTISSLAERICSGGIIKIVLLAGPSGSGKTTTANLLSDAIKANGEDCMVVSLDDFYRDASDPDYPRLENGERDFETVEALDIKKLTATLTDMVELREFSVPRYDFKTGRVAEVRHYAPINDGCVIIEGLHALNPRIFSSLPADSVLKIFISVSTNITRGGDRILSGRKIRFCRRMVRDNLYRGASAERTLDFWDGVLRGEDKYLYPTRRYADITFDTFHAFELSVMRPFVEALISDGLAAQNAYASTVLAAVRHAIPLKIDLVPENSLIREFIPGGKYEHLY